MEKVLQDIKKCKSQEELYYLLKDIPEVYHLIFRRDILSKFEKLKQEDTKHE